jgi:hypothetical protein
MDNSDIQELRLPQIAPPSAITDLNLYINSQNFPLASPEYLPARYILCLPCGGAKVGFEKCDTSPLDAMLLRKLDILRISRHRTLSLDMPTLAGFIFFVVRTHRRAFN